VIGFSEGNGHPYSWSAIFNGYDPVAMATCPFPVIPAYLAERSFPQDAIAEAAVTHVWTQDPAISRHVASASLVPNVVVDPVDMIGHVDGVLLARDDARSHPGLATPFLAAGIPVYIDKPLALDVAGAQALYRAQSRPGLIFTCSALAYAEELLLPDAELAALGRILYVDAVTPKDWDRYAVHIVEPLLQICRLEGAVTRTAVSGSALRRLEVSFASGAVAAVTALGVPTGFIAIRVFGEKGWRELRFHDSFSAFRSALRVFTDIVLGRRPPQAEDSVLPVIHLIEAGRAVETART
jgi:hypothetical protein